MAQAGRCRHPPTRTDLAHIVYALCGHGRGHTSRALAVAATLRARGHRVTFACGGPGADRLQDLGEAVLHVPALRQVLKGNRVRLWASAQANVSLTWRSPEIIGQAAAALRTLGADLVVGDHEPFVPRAANRAGIPAVALNHQQILTETRCTVPHRYALSAWTTTWGIGFLAPPVAEEVIVPTFFFPRLRQRSDAVLVPPILRDDLLATHSTLGDHILVYMNEGEGLTALLRRLGRLDAPVRAYGLSPETTAPENVRLCAPSREGFLADLASARAVIATAGFTLLSEALHLGKPILALPNRGFFEQRVNAIYLERSGRGEQAASLPSARRLRAFLERSERYRRPQASALVGLAGRRAAADRIEQVLAEVPASTWRSEPLRTRPRFTQTAARA